jgi:hypothetical protein
VWEPKKRKRWVRQRSNKTAKVVKGGREKDLSWSTIDWMMEALAELRPPRNFFLLAR